jgi:hypothetical protein
MTPEEQIKILEAICDHLHRRVIAIQIELEAEISMYDGYGTSLMTNEDRLFNRLVSCLVYAHSDVPPHDDEALRWIEKALHG